MDSVLNAFAEVSNDGAKRNAQRIADRGTVTTCKVHKGAGKAWGSELPRKRRGSGARDRNAVSHVIPGGPWHAAVHWRGRDTQAIPVQRFK
ncbi:hypothetical protein DBA20_00330 [Pandoraea capi]|nr:hypothetical protein [Pandoraea sp. LA3]MDN4581436.1 hypothetical protein [Pandoraea capi]